MTQPTWTPSEHSSACWPTGSSCIWCESESPPTRDPPASSSRPTWWWKACAASHGCSRCLLRHEVSRVPARGGTAVRRRGDRPRGGVGGGGDALGRQRAAVRGARLVAGGCRRRPLDGQTASRHAGDRPAARRRQGHHFTAGARAGVGALQPPLAAGRVRGGRGAIGFFLPQVPAVATGYALLVALS